jgi:hypothetical protein
MIPLMENRVQNRHYILGLAVSVNLVPLYSTLIYSPILLTTPNAPPFMLCITILTRDVWRVDEEKKFRYGESNPELPREFHTEMKGGNVSRYTIPDGASIF